MPTPAACCREVRAAVTILRDVAGMPAGRLAVRVRRVHWQARVGRLRRRIVRAWTSPGSWRGPLRGVRLWGGGRPHPRQ